jgi:hypothetical protein
MRNARFLIVTLLLCLAIACGPPEVEPTRPIGEAFVGPAKLEVRSELGLRSQVVATAKHGDRVDILQTRRRFVKVRTGAKGAKVEGWVDGRNLLSSAKMAELEKARAMSEKAPSQGRATVYDPLNVHTEPNRQSPNMAQIPAGGSVDVLAHMVAPRVAFRPATDFIKPPPRPTPRKRRSRKSARQVEALATPPTPTVPPNWRELSKTTLPEEPPPPPVKTPKGMLPVDPEKSKAPLQDDWTLVRTPDKQVGWVLTRMLSMAIPDEVARYAEGKRITSYFPLGDVNDDGATKRHWVWTTISAPYQTHDFDAFRVFVYRLKKHRYETAYQEKELKGYYPVTLSTAKIVENRKELTVPAFSVVVEDDSGRLWQRTYAFQINRVRMVNQVPYEKPASKEEPGPSLTQIPSQEAGKSWWRRLFKR